MRSLKCLLAGVALISWMGGVDVDAKDVRALQETGSAFAEIAKSALPAASGRPGTELSNIQP